MTRVLMEAPRAGTLEPRADATSGEPWCRNLLHTFEELLAHFEECRPKLGKPGGARAAWWDAYFTACALSQVLDDFTHRGFLGVAAKLETALARPHKLERFVEVLPRRTAGLVRWLVGAGSLRAAARIVDGLAALRVRARGALLERRLLAAAERLHGTVLELALGCLGRPGPGAPDAPLAGFRPGTRLARRALKVPSGLKDFDCHPEDLAELARRFAARVPDRGAPVTVVGIRTSGSWLAGLLAAGLRLEGFGDVQVASIRQKVPLFPRERRRLAERGRRGTVVLIDDPPVTGGAQRKVLRALSGIGVPPERIVALIFQDPEAPLFRDAAPAPNDLIGRAVLLPKSDWRIRRELAGGEELRARGARLSRCHEKARLVAEGSVRKGIGSGWFERHARETAAALPEFVPEVRPGPEGVLVTGWVEGPTLLERPEACDAGFVRAVGRYVAARARRLAIRSGVPGDLEDRDSGWFVLAQAFAQSYSFLAPLAYTPLRRRLARIGAGAPRAAIDGRMGPAEWIVPEDGRPPVKVDFEEHDFDRMDVAILDPALDLAAFAVECRLTPALERVLIEEYLRAFDDPGLRDRLPTFRLMAGVSRLSELRYLLANGGSISLGFDRAVDPKAAGVELAEVERQLADAANAFLARAVGADGPPAGPERLFAIDLDGVLEDGTLGFNATTPAGALAIRTLRRHGFQPVVATGRSLGEVVARSEAFALRAGVAEYGAVAWLEGRTIDLVAADEREQLERLRRLLDARGDLVVDPAFRHSVRVFRLRKGSRRAPPLEELEEALRGAGLDRLRIVPGDAQLDVVGKDCNKGRALLALKEGLGARELHAVGDTVEDAAMLRVADRAWAPANARTALRRAFAAGGLHVARRRLERGLLEVARIAAHGRDRDCAECRASAPRAEDRELLRAFGLRDRPRALRLLDLVGRGALDHFLVTR